MAPGLTRARQGPRGGPGTCSLSLGGSGASVYVCRMGMCEVCKCCCMLQMEFLYRCMFLGRGCNEMFLSSVKCLTSVEDI